VSATNADGTSPFSAISPPVTTEAFIAPQPTSVQVISPPPAPSCANGGVACLVGDVGPGGGTVFYVATTPFACGPTRASMCRYLEAAPSGWDGPAGDPIRKWSKISESRTVVNNPTSPETATATAIGWGYRNTLAIILQGNDDPATTAAAKAQSYESSGDDGTDFNDWYLPSKDELSQMCKWQRGIAWVSDASGCVSFGAGAINTGPGAEGFTSSGGGYYWSSSEIDLFRVWEQSFVSGGTDMNTKHNEIFEDYIRPIRAF